MILPVKGIDKNMQIATVYELYLEENNGNHLPILIIRSHSSCRNAP
jgi:hypothetical protein